MDLGETPPPRPLDASTEDALEGDAGGSAVKVTLFALRFAPGAIRISPGTIVRWTNLDAVPHTVTEGAPGATAAPLFDSPMLGTGESFTYRFMRPGEWIYYCRTHPNIMRDNKVTVQ